MFVEILQGKLSKKEAYGKIDVIAYEIYKTEQKELILHKDPLFNPELIKQVLSEIILCFFTKYITIKT